MDDFLSDISDEDLEIAKRRIWNRLHSKLPDRELELYQPLLDQLSGAQSTIAFSRLQRVQSKEHLLDVLPERESARFLPFTKKLWATATLSMFFAVLFVPVFESNIAIAAVPNTLQVVQGQVRVNGQLVEGTAKLEEGDQIVAMHGSLAHIRFADDSRVTLGPNTSLFITDIDLNALGSHSSSIALRQDSGRMWTQVVNLASSDSDFKVAFPDGEVSVKQRASFDLRVAENDSELKVVRNLVQVDIEGEESYRATLGQGAGLQLAGDFIVRELNEAEAKETWWEFNEDFGREYAFELDQRYRNDAVNRVRILPGNPLYGLKTFREDVQVAFSFSDNSKQELAVKHAKNRLDEAQVLIERGRDDSAAAVLEKYEERVESLQGSGDERLLAELAETEKAILSKADSDSGDQLLESSVAETKAVLSSEHRKADAIIETASQQLARVPDAISEGNLQLAMLYLSNYKENARSLLTQLEDVSLDDREALISKLLDQKLRDLQMLRVISSLTEVSELVDADGQILEDINLLVLSLNQRSLQRLADFFTNTDYDLSTQYSLYQRLKGSSDIPQAVSDKLETIENELNSLEEGNVVIDVERIDKEAVPEVIDPRFGDL